MAGIDLSNEAVGKATEVAPGFWVIATRHHPGGSAKMPEINNRCLVFKLEEAGTPLLLVVNGVDGAAIAQVQRIQEASGLQVRYIVSPGGGHHFLMPHWQQAFTDAKVLLPPARIPRTASGQKLLAMDRVELMDAADPLPQFRGQLDAVLFDGLYGVPDAPAPGEGGSDGMGYMMRMMINMMFRVKDPIDELWLHHVASGTVIGGENLGWMYPNADLQTQPMMIKSMVKPDRVYIFDGPRKVADKATVSKNWQRICAWPAKSVMTYHDVTGHAFHGDGQTALREAATAVGQL